MPRWQAAAAGGSFFFRLVANIISASPAVVGDGGIRLPCASLHPAILTDGTCLDLAVAVNRLLPRGLRAVQILIAILANSGVLSIFSIHPVKYRTSGVIFAIVDLAKHASLA